MLASVVDRTLL